MKLGAEPKQVGIFAGLILLAAVMHFTGDDGRPKSDGGKRTPPAAAPVPVSGSAGPRTLPVAAKKAPRPNSRGRSSQEFKPVLRPKRVEDRIDPASIDPTLRTDLLARLGNVPIQGGDRPLFEFSAAPKPPEPPPAKIIPTPPVSLGKPGTSPLSLTPPKPTTPAKTTAPPIPLKFYGFTAVRGGAKRGFFLENEDVYVANEGEIVKKRYKVVRINLNSVVMEDTQYSQQQTLALTEQTQ